MDTVFDCVVHHIHDASDRSSFSLVSRTCYDLDAKTREHVTVHLCYATPLRCRQRFPFIESLTLTGNPRIVDSLSSSCNWDHNLTPWVQEIATSLKCLKMVRFQNLDVRDSDIELLVRTRGEKLRVLEIDSCSGFSTDGLLYIGKYCNHLRILSLENSLVDEKDGKWLHELALHSSSIESLNFYRAGLTKFDVKDLALVAKTCSQSLVSVKISEHYDFIDLVEFFNYAVKLEDFGGGRFGDNNPINHNHIGMNLFGNDPFDDVIAAIDMNQFGNNALGMNPILHSAQRAKYKDFKFPSNLKYLALNHKGQNDIVLPFAHLITQLDTHFVYDRRHRRHHHQQQQQQHSLIENCPNLEVLYTAFISNKGMEHLSQYCKNLRKLYVTDRRGPFTEKGLFALALGCRQLECLHINLAYITFEAMVHIGINLKNLSDLSMKIRNKGVSMADSVIDNGIRSLLIGCDKLERLSICFQELGGLSDIGLSYIGRFGCNLRYMSLGYAGESDAGLVELSFGCPKLQNLVINDCPFSKEAFDVFRCNVPSLRYFQVQGMHRHCRYLLEEDQPNFRQIV